MTTTTPAANLQDTIHHTADWLARASLSGLDRFHTELVDAVDVVAVAAESPEALRPDASDPTPALVRLFNHHACTIAQRERNVAA